MGLATYSKYLSSSTTMASTVQLQRAEHYTKEVAMSNTHADLIAQLTDMLEGLADPKEASVQAEEARAKDLPKARQFSSLGFVVVGDGPAPDSGTVLQVPTKAGKVARVRTIEQIDTSPFNGEFGDWAFTYKRLKRGES